MVSVLVTLYHNEFIEVKRKSYRTIIDDDDFEIVSLQVNRHSLNTWSELDYLAYSRFVKTDDSDITTMILMIALNYLMPF